MKSTKNKEKFYLSKGTRLQIEELIEMGFQYGFTQVFLAVKFCRKGWTLYPLMSKKELNSPVLFEEQTGDDYESRIKSNH